MVFIFIISCFFIYDTFITFIFILISCDFIYLVEGVWICMDMPSLMLPDHVLYQATLSLPGALPSQAIFHNADSL